ncbi:hypothetical protein SCLCIDRAFT_32799 [Scleroderma citrinum Foug A]|uniref:Ricin B lectin domain-containing protein n=1 Tax=Scleroderma citrinum Foug A TaxID=1036808 RepID=A0A0C2ZHE3_9AGAM|nr:hypothetical protein SCLCIDRAFT_32799 [Scleroderma citrinum Foug A]
MANTHTLPSDSYYIFSEVDGKSLNLCDDTSVAREPVVVGNKQLLFRIQAVDPSNNIYTIWTEGHGRHIRGGDVHIYGSVDRATPQRWIITYQPSRNAYK